MRRRRKKFEEEPESNDRWLVSYADFITLLFAFFVVMYAISSINEGKYRVLSDSITTAFGKDATAIIEPIKYEAAAFSNLARKPIIVQKKTSSLNLRKLREQKKMQKMATNLLESLSPLVNQGRVRVVKTESGISVEINASVLFKPAQAELSAESVKVLTTIAQILVDDQHLIQVEGHTDNLPIQNRLYPSNWELSAVRASSVVRLFIQEGVEEKRLMAMGYGKTRPVATNETKEGRLRNRRVKLLILAKPHQRTTSSS